MKSVYLIILFKLFANCFLLAETTPMDLVLKEDGVTLIAVDLKKADLKDKNPDNAKLIDGTYHYNVYVPAGYNSQLDRKYPCLFIASPGGNAALGNVKNWVKEKEWIVVMLVESKNGPWEPIFSNFSSAHDDAVKRLRIQPGFKFGTGFSGGARVSSNMPKRRDGFAGIILQGAGFGGGYESCLNNKNLTVYAIIGSKDSNHYELAELEKKLPAHTERKLISLDIGHQWAPEDEMIKALDWTINQAFQKSRITKDNRSFIIGYREKQLKDINEMPSSLDKLNQLEDLSGFLRANQVNELNGEANIAAKISTQIADLKKEPMIISESSAEKLYSQCRKSESMIRSKNKDINEIKKQLMPLFVNYGKIAKDYPSTEYGKKAQETYNALDKEFSFIKK